ncbi:acyl-CoA dehydrogenase [Rhodococcus sp. NPDC127530]|uniref:acyl-CoA dehydrogenase n=1 Tax=unclassified Rhodococcus (in: high G+C Gram-positive bacteria) TaxID=192944 RepID=UPI00362982FD
MYQTPVQDYEFHLDKIIDGQQLLDTVGPEDTKLADISEILSHAGEFSTAVIHPLNVIGDRAGVSLEDGRVTSAPGYVEAYRDFVGAGWLSVGVPEDVGGDGMPHIVTNALDELWAAGSPAFNLCTGLTVAAAQAILTSGDDEIRRQFLPPLVSGRWTGTMNLTEPQAGTDLAAIRSIARPNPDGTWAVKGQKIFITWGDHDVAENIVHLVLARTPDAPDGLAGLSLFVVPKFLSHPDGTLGERNAVKTLALEHKLGLHGSPTCVLEYENATGFLLGALHRGLEGMFVMMNISRIGIGVQSLGVADRAYQMARDYAQERVQGRVVGRTDSGPIAEHPDVARLLLSMASTISGMRALSVQASAWIDLSGSSAAARKLADFFSPIVKGWFSESAVQITSDAIQVYGGSGFIEESGIAQYYRDSRILPIYEGTTAVQANDLVGRKILRDKGVVALSVLDRISDELPFLRAADHPVAARTADRLERAVNAARSAIDLLLARAADAPRDVYAASVPVLLMWGLLGAGWMHARILLAALDVDDEHTPRRVREADFFGAHHLSRIASLLEAVEAGEIR